MKEPTVWQKIKEAVESLGSPTTNVAVRDWILKRYPTTNKNTIQCTVIVCTVNHPSRVHYPENNRKPRQCDTQYDFLYRPERGKLERYDPQRHGRYEILEKEDGSLAVGPVEDGSGRSETTTGCEETLASSNGNAFAAETHLRDYLAQHLTEIEAGLDLYVDENGIEGIEYNVPIGRIDILATDTSGNLVVIELKVGQGPDAVCGQVLRYMGWVKRHIADKKPVRGIIIAQRISDRIRYALADTPNVQLKEYELSLKLRNAEPLE